MNKIQEVANQVCSSKEDAIKFLKSAGIINKNGKLKRIYKNGKA